MDIELVPKNIWVDFQGQSTGCLQEVNAYQSNRNVAHLQNANTHLDNLLTYVRPYFSLPSSVLESLYSSAIAYGTQLEQYVESFHKKVTVTANDIEQQKTKVIESLGFIEQSKNRVDSVVIDLIDGDANKVSIKKSIEDTKAVIDKQVEELSTMHKSMLVDEPNVSVSIKTQIEAAKTNVIDVEQKINKLLTNSKSDIDELDEFHKKIFGSQDTEGKLTEGLKQELDARVAQIGNLQREQTTNYNALFIKIEGLLPGATSAGLASAYETSRKEFEGPIKWNERVFYAAVCCMIIFGALTLFDLPTWTIIKYDNTEAILKAMLMKLPFMAPLIWIAVFASIRRSQYERLQQEYAHKEAFAKSYESYRKQLESLTGTDVESLQKELIAKAIDAIAFNASSTLDGRHRDKMPLEHALELLSDEKNQSFLDRFRKLLTLK